MTTLPSSGFSGRGYLVLHKDGTILNFGNAPGTNSVNVDDPPVAIAIQPAGGGCAVLSKGGAMSYSNVTGEGGPSSTNPFVDLIYTSAAGDDNDGLWALDDHCGVSKLGSACAVGRQKSQSNCIRISMLSWTSGKVLDSHGHLYSIDDNSDQTDSVDFDNGAVAGGLATSSAYHVATDQTTVKTLTWDSKDNGSLADFYPTATGATAGDTVLKTGRFNVVDIAYTPSGNGYWLLVNFRSTFNLCAQYTVIAVGDARALGGIDPTTVMPYTSLNSVSDGLRIAAMPALDPNIPDLFLDALYLPMQYAAQGATSWNDAATGYQAMVITDLGSQYKIYLPLITVTGTPDNPTGVYVTLVLQYVTTAGKDDYVVLKLTYSWAAGGWSLSECDHAFYEGSDKAASAAKSMDVAVNKILQGIDTMLVADEVMSAGTLTPVFVALGALAAALTVCETFGDVSDILSEGGAGNFLSVTAHALVRASNSLGPPSSVDFAAGFPSLDADCFASDLAASVSSTFGSWSTGLPSGNSSTEMDVTVGSDGELGASSGDTVTFRIWLPEQSMGHNGGGSLISTMIDIDENNQLDAHCALLCCFAQVQGTAPDGSPATAITLVGVTGGVYWLSLMPTEGKVMTRIKPCVIGQPDPNDNTKTLASTDDILAAVLSLIENGAKNQHNCSESIGDGLANFAVATVQSMLTSLGAV